MPKQIQEKSNKPCEGAECLADLAASLDADLFIKAEVSKAGEKCAFSAKLYKRKPNTVLYFVDQTKIESCLCQADDLQKAAHILGKKLSSQQGEKGVKREDIKAIKPTNPVEEKMTEASGKKEEPMVLIPAGEFMMGCNEAVDNQCGGDEKPYHKVHLDEYYIDKYEVTVDGYVGCVRAGKCLEPGSGEDCNWRKDDRGSHPINCVDWSQAKSYCEWVGKRLPTEAKWEKAARGTDGRKYPWGNQPTTCDYAVIERGCGRNSTWPVGSKPKGASPYGLMDMAGNAWEWVEDWYHWKYYESSPSSNPPGPSSSLINPVNSHQARVMRGGSWQSDSNMMRTSDRSLLGPTNRLFVGFRCARDAK